ncbi:NTP transferase domain-containing protein [Cyanobium sp. Alchichica 3B3-8F6]|uniref:NTP transferase domain-containing protein n=1 Tax=Cyanobium sp. Alchichica 3B3-8F6 TaxID=2823696 RepID=UPI0020CDEF01|nr:NTP transferase domain-containing protein [Cyanobium sp. Alchichica 3B3-8F6]MCP9882389.1 NTP transferase domain-containing protein [Cyanobium sp. Alchichica 3B3-8F6]
MIKEIPCVAIFSGGEGKRIRDSEILPKPFIDINGKPLVRRVSDQLLKLSSFPRLVLLTCSSNYNALQFIGDSFSGVHFSICEESKMAGKLSAMKFFFDKYPDIDLCLFANADTLFLDQNALCAAFNNINQISDSPCVFLANPDKTRSDYKEVIFEINGKTFALQNSGVFVASRNWTYESYHNAYRSKGLALDDILFDTSSSDFVFVDSDILDVGTPQRVKMARELIDDNY